MKVMSAASLAVLVMTAAACSTPRTKTMEVKPETLAPVVAVNRFADLKLAEPDRNVPAWADASLDPLRAPTLTRFNSEAEFLSWLTLVREAASQRGVHNWRDMPVAMSAPTATMDSAAMSPPPPPPPPAMAMESAAAEEIVVTGSTIPADPSNPEITNNQKAGVDEGGIVKQIGNHLVVLQDGRLFVTDLAPCIGFYAQTLGLRLKQDGRAHERTQPRDRLCPHVSREDTGVGHPFRFRRAATCARGSGPCGPGSLHVWRGRTVVRRATGSPIPRRPPASGGCWWSSSRWRCAASRSMRRSACTRRTSTRCSARSRPAGR